MKTDKNSIGITQAVNAKMKVLADFKICNECDNAMRIELIQAAKNKPEKDLREVLDYYCRPMIQAKVNSWN